MKVLAITCHPDDMELTCAGTLLKCKARGDEVFVCHIANGNMGHMVIMPDELREIRAKEAQKAAALAGFTIVTTDVGDLTVNSADMNQVRALIKVIRDVNPDLILCHSPEDYCSDHCEASKLVFKASFDASCPHFMPDLGPASKVASIYYVDHAACMNFIPTEYVDVTDVMELKEKMLACHESQLVWLKEHDGIDVIDHQRVYARYRGLQSGVMYAEGFKPLLADQRMKTYRLLP
ncbi:MAG: PIG-L family deacetylase [Clostridia bacterium]|nr:PIG-L family deacetylase [Clostridia bacterium]